MRENQPSYTSYRVALSRAAHQLLEHPVVFEDALALRIIGAKARADLEANPERANRLRRSRNIRALLAARSRLAEDALAQAVARGATQYVVLGAGLDTFAYRNTNPSLRIFEVDHPDTQRWKRERLREAGIPEPANLTFVPVNFERQDLGAEMATAGFAPDRPSFMSWLGVLVYLERPAIWATLRWIASNRESGVAFDYGVHPRTLRHRLAFWFFSRRVKRAGEPFRTQLEPDEVAAGLREAGFTSVEDFAGPEINRRYFAARADGFAVGPLAHVVVART
ncbi:MAG TPA: SAM-dependent methyltransferase [Gemmatimonadales bacterium]|jgi:methyltransferase (TIGR00027 family)